MRRTGVSRAAAVAADLRQLPTSGSPSVARRAEGRAADGSGALRYLVPVSLDMSHSRPVIARAFCLSRIAAISALARNPSASDNVRNEARRMILVVADAGAAGVMDDSGVEHLSLSEGLRRLAVSAEKGIDGPEFERVRSRITFERNGRVCRQLFVPRLVREVREKRRK